MTAGKRSARPWRSLVLDNDQRVLLANEAFAQMLGQTPQKLQGRSAAELPWKYEASEDPGGNYPWTQTLGDGMRRSGTVLKLEGNESGTRTLRVNCAPVAGDDGSCRGVLATFDDITLFEERNATLADTLDRLKESKDVVRRQNEQLTTLATLDPLTLCLNRRAFFEEFDEQLRACQITGRPLSCLLADIDHFKSVNDNHGHAAGDAVLKMVAEVLRETVGDGGTVGRYGGEEFCAILPGLDIDAATAEAQKIREAIEGCEHDGLSVTASLGVSTSGDAAWDQQALMEQADQAMYAAKRTGLRDPLGPDTRRHEVSGIHVRTLRGCEGIGEAKLAHTISGVRTLHQPQKVIDENKQTGLQDYAREAKDLRGTPT